MIIKETILASGHKNISATHATTFEITKDHWLSKRGHCIIAVSANKALSDLSASFKAAIRREDARMRIVIEVGGLKEIVEAFGSPKLILTHEKDIVVRRSGYICERTLAIRANKAARDFSRLLVKKLQIPEQLVKITLIAKI